MTDQFPVNSKLLVQSGIFQTGMFPSGSVPTFLKKRQACGSRSECWDRQEMLSTGRSCVN